MIFGDKVIITNEKLLHPLNNIYSQEKYQQLIAKYKKEYAVVTKVLKDGCIILFEDETKCFVGKEAIKKI